MGGDLESKMKANEELVIRHKLNPNKPNRNKYVLFSLFHIFRKRKNKNKGMKIQKEEFPGLPGT